MKSKYTPYIIILALCVFMSGARATVIREWSIWMHLIVFALQFLLLCVIWQTISLTNRQLEKRFRVQRNPLPVILLQVILSLLIISPFFLLFDVLIQPYLPPYVDSRMIRIVYVLAIMAMLLLNFVFFTYKFFLDLRQSLEEKARLELKTEQLAKEKMMMQYHHLKNQVNPHFLFNTLTSLDGLIHTNPDMASDFVRHLSKVYRYVLEHKENEVVNMATELAFIEHYIQLLQIRYGSAISITMDISEDCMDKGIVMVTLQMLIDNATKHNIVSKENPLHISILDKEGYLVIRNNKQLRKQIDHSTKHGLKQLKDLYAFLTTTPVEVLDSTDYFQVKLPLL